MKVIIAGDFCPINRVESCFEKGDFASVLSEVKNITSNVDYSIVNFECPICENFLKPILKEGPHLRCIKKSVEALKWAGFKGVTLANNHFRDYGDAGVKETIDTFHKAGIDIVGGGNLEDCAKPLSKSFDSEKLAIINCCEHEFSIASSISLGSNPLNPIKQYYDIQKAKNNSCKVIVIVHGGNEHLQYPSPRMKEVYRFFIDAGADAVINHHQHCYSGYEIYEGKPIFYGLGNFCFDFPNVKTGLWDYGYMVELELSDEISFRLIPYSQCKDSPRIKLLNDNDFEIFCNNISKINDIINNDYELDIIYKKYLDSAFNQCDLLFQPYSRWSTSTLYKKHLLPSFVSKKKCLKLLSFIQCESQVPKLTYYLKKRLGI